MRALRAQPRLRRSALVGLAVTSVVALAACGSSSSSSSGGSSSAGSDVSAAKLAEAKAVVTKLSAKPATITVDQKLAKKPAAGKVIVNVYPPNPSQTLNAKALAEAGKALGFTVKSISVGTTADSMSAAFDAALALHPAGVNVNAIDPSQWSTYAKKFAAAGIPYVNQGGSVKNVDGKTLNFLTLSGVATLFQSLGDWAVADADGKAANTLIVKLSGTAVYDAATSAIKSRITSLCPKCSVTTLGVSAADMGTKSPDEIVSALQRNPKINYVLFPLAGAETGLVPALKTAGLNTKVKVGIVAGATAQDQELKNGDIAVDMQLDQFAQAYLTMDFFARALTGESTATDEKWLFPKQFLTKSTVDPSTSYRAGSPSQWTDLWAGAQVGN